MCKLNINQDQFNQNANQMEQTSNVLLSSIGNSKKSKDELRKAEFLRIGQVNIFIV